MKIGEIISRLQHVEAGYGPDVEVWLQIEKEREAFRVTYLIITGPASFSDAKEFPATVTFSSGSPKVT